MADKTAIFESAQALFCAIADYIGISKTKKILNLETYPTYSKFKSEKKNKDIIKKAFSQTRLIGVSLSQIETLLKDNTWYESSVLIAVKLLDDIKKIDSDFAKIQGAGWQDFFYVRGATGGNTTMNNIDLLFSFANKKDKKFGDINKWSPADIYFVSENAKKIIQDEIDEANKNESYTFIQLNTICNRLIASGELLPLSLKKVIDGRPVIVKYNFNRSQEEKNLAKLVFIETKKSGTGRDIQIFFQNNKSQLKIRHDPHHSKFGASAGMKGEIIVQGMGGRLGSIGSMEIFLNVLKDSGLKSGDKFYNDLKKQWIAGMTAYKKGIDKLNKTYKVKSSDSHLKLSEVKYNKYKAARAIVSKKQLMDKIIPVIDDYFNKNNKKKNKNSFSDSTMMIQTFIKYASSRSPLSGKFVIAK
jgi:hypothetical protein